MTGPSRLQQRLRLFDAVTIVAGSMIGSAIFFGLSIMAQWVQTPGILIGLWVFGGVFTILGTMAFGELAGMFPHAGGQYVYLREAYSEFWGFLFGWTQFMVVQTGFNAAVAIAFAKYLGSLIPVLGEEHVLIAIPLADLLPSTLHGAAPVWIRHLTVNSAQCVACGVIAVLTAVNIRGVREGALVQNLFTVLKLVALAALIAAGLTRSSGLAHFFPLWEPVAGPAVSWTPGGGALQTAFLAGLAGAGSGSGR
ncbi:MAG: amino acid permease, partial [Anaerolineae bacterium]|nr:amino acid permease [Anaerolineae bacterium]